MHSMRDLEDTRQMNGIATYLMKMKIIKMKVA